jgi:uncharacterized Zn-finger protein
MSYQRLKTQPPHLKIEEASSISQTDFDKLKSDKPVIQLTQYIPKIWCPLCTNDYASKANVYRHITNVHANERRFSCLLCPEKFNFKHDLIRHKKNKHGSIP